MRWAEPRTQTKLLGDQSLSLSGPESSIAFDLHQGTYTMKTAPKKKEKITQSYMQLFHTHFHNSKNNTGHNLSVENSGVREFSNPNKRAATWPLPSNHPWD